MKMKLVLLCLFIIISFQANSQSNLIYAPDTRFVSAENMDPFLISTRPITNREYILFIIWTHEVYGTDYPERFFEVLPVADTCKHSWNLYDELNPGKRLLISWIEKSSPIIRDYMFNPKYIDYPVVGISWYQAGLFCHWLTDRYNENKLMESRVLKFNPNQQNNENFNTAAYLAGKYEGMRRLGTAPMWPEHILIPAFRLPSMLELAQCQTQGITQSDFKAYPLSKKSFLHLWDAFYLKVSDDMFVIQSANYPIDTIPSSGKDWLAGNSGFIEMTLDNGKSVSSASITEIYAAAGQAELNYPKLMQLEKDSLGSMRYLIIAEKEDQTPLIVELYKKSHASDPSQIFFIRYACSMKEGQFSKD